MYRITNESIEHQKNKPFWVKIMTLFIRRNHLKPRWFLYRSLFIVLSLVTNSTA